MEEFLAEDVEQVSAMFVRHDGGRLSTAKPCFCVELLQEKDAMMQELEQMQEGLRKEQSTAKKLAREGSQGQGVCWPQRGGFAPCLLASVEL